jgi:general secretion pathway protein J
MNKSGGFTLFEILIALFIFAILAMLAALCLHSVIKTREHLKGVDKTFLALQITNVFWQRDVSQIVDRSILDANDERLPAVLSHGASEVEFTTMNTYTPNFVYRRGNLQRVAYVLKKHNLERLIWPTLDRVANSSSPSAKVIFKGVQSVQIQYLDQTNQWGSFWPEQNSQNAQSDKKPTLPKALKMTLVTQHLGTYIRIVNLAGANRNVASNT